ncbi:unnamed protein product, partial [Phaeothamnion confervicola]
MEAMLEDLVHYYLAQWLYSTATFYAERLMAHRPSEESLLLLASCYSLAGQPQKVHAVLQGCKSPSNRFLLAKTCCDLNKIREAQHVLLEGESTYAAEAELTADPCPVPGGAAGLYLLGRATQADGR